MMLDKKRWHKVKKKKQKLTKRTYFWVLQKTSTFPRVVWAEEPKTGFIFEIRPSFDGPSYDDIPTMSQLVVYRQSSCNMLRVPTLG